MPPLKHPLQEQLHASAEDIRWATPEIVAEYRAKRLKCNIIVDVGCGIGFQSFAFAKQCQKVYAIDSNAEKIEKARKNAAILGITNIEFIHGDALDPKIIGHVKKAEIVFCDPERLAAEEQRSMGTILPNINMLLHAYAPITAKIAVELPPQIKEIPYEGEREYCSVEGALNRLTLYCGALQKCERSAIVLPSEERLRNNPKAVLKRAKRIGSFLYEADPAVVKAGLLAELSSTTKTALFSEQKAVFFTGDQAGKEGLFKNAFRVVGIMHFEDKRLISFLQERGFGTVVIRYGVDPLDYWKERKKYEDKLNGEKTAYVFQFGLEVVVGEKV